LLCGKLYIVRKIKIGRLMRLGRLYRMQDLDPCRKLNFLKPEVTRRVGKPKMKWLESLEEEHGREELGA